MRSRRFAPVLTCAAALALVAAFPATAKEGVEATITSNVPLDAPGGTRLHVGWTLAYIEDGQQQPFDAGGLYMRLRSASGAQPETAWAGGDRGSYSASIAVPKGGIGDIEFGLVGWRTVESGTQRADVTFPITNDPLPGDPRGSSPAASVSEVVGNWAVWLALLVIATLSAAVVLGVLARRRPQPRLG